MSYKIVVHKIQFDFSKVGDNFLENVYKELERLYKNKCMSEHGIILDIDKNIEIIDNFIVNNCLLLEVRFKIKYIKPELDKIISGKVSSIRKECILVNINDKILGIIPSTKLKHKLNDKNEFILEN